MSLSPARIEELAAQPKVKRNATVNFLCSLGDLSYQEAIGNLEMDRQSYKWNLETYSAIWQGILENFK